MLLLLGNLQILSLQIHLHRIMAMLGEGNFYLHMTL